MESLETIRVVPNASLLLREKNRPISSKLAIDPPDVERRVVDGSIDLSHGASIGDEVEGREIEGGREKMDDLDDGLERRSRKMEGLLVDDLRRSVFDDLSG